MRSLKLISLAGAAALLLACSAGDGNPGECHASPQVCADFAGRGGGGGSVSGDVTGLWNGTTSNGRTAFALTLASKQAWVIYTSAANPSLIAGAIEGTYSTNGNTLTSADALDANFEGLGVNPATITATVSPHSSIGGTVLYTSGTTVTFSGSYNPQFAAQPSLAAVAATYSGSAIVGAGLDTATTTIAADGSMTGSTVLGCHFAGTATPETNANVYDLSIQFQGAPCSNGTGTVTGVAYVDSTSNRVYAAALNAGRTDGFLFVGAKQ